MTKGSKEEKKVRTRIENSNTDGRQQSRNTDHLVKHQWSTYASKAEIVRIDQKTRPNGTLSIRNPPEIQRHV